MRRQVKASGARCCRGLRPVQVVLERQVMSRPVGGSQTRTESELRVGAGMGGMARMEWQRWRWWEKKCGPQCSASLEIPEDIASPAGHAVLCKIGLPERCFRGGKGRRGPEVVLDGHALVICREDAASARRPARGWPRRELHRECVRSSCGPATSQCVATVSGWCSAWMGELRRFASD